MPVRLAPVTVRQLIARLADLPPTAVVRSGIIKSKWDQGLAEFTVVLEWPIELEMPKALVDALKEPQ